MSWEGYVPSPREKKPYIHNLNQISTDNSPTSKAKNRKWNIQTGFHPNQTPQQQLPTRPQSELRLEVKSRKWNIQTGLHPNQTPQQQFPSEPELGLDSTSRKWNIHTGLHPNQTPQLQLPLPDQVKKKSSNFNFEFMRSKKVVGSLVVGFIFVLVVVVVSVSVSNNSNGFNLDDEIAEDILLFPEETRSNNDLVGLFFTTPPRQFEADAFISAAQKWSRVIAGSPLQSGLFSGTIERCGLGLALGENRQIDHLIIFIVIEPIDGRGGTLAAAGPCQIFGNFPVFGIMTFDSADIDRQAQLGRLETVVLHEMAHVLGLGTRWIDFDLLVDSVFQGGGVFEENQPKYLGQNAISEFQSLGGQLDFVPVENGIFKGKPLFPPGGGLGSVDGHWDRDIFLGELMELSIGGVQPMSTITIGSLVDLGYNCDFSQADIFALRQNNLRREDGDVEVDEVEVSYLLNDILDFEPIFLEPDF